MTDKPQDPGVRDEQERVRAMKDQLKHLHAADLGYEMTLSLVSFGYQKLGLSEDTAELRDLGDVRLSIELLRALLGVLETQGADAPGVELRDTLAQLQLAYAHAVQLAAAPEPEAGDAGSQDAGPAGASAVESSEPAQPAGSEPQLEPDSGSSASYGGSPGG